MNRCAAVRQLVKKLRVLLNPLFQRCGMRQARLLAAVAASVPPRRIEYLVRCHCRRLAVRLLHATSRLGSIGNLDLAVVQLRRLVEAAVLIDATRGPCARDAKVLLWELFLPLVRSEAARFVQAAWAIHRMTLDDLLSEAFLKFDRVIARFDATRATLCAWLHRVLRNHFIQMTCRLQRPIERSLSLEGVGDANDGFVERPSSAVNAFDVLDDVCRNEQHAAVNDTCRMIAAAGHPQEWMAAFRLRFLHELKLKEIASQMNRSVSWVHKVTNQMLKNFADVFENRYPGIVLDFASPDTSPNERFDFKQSPPGGAGHTPSARCRRHVPSPRVTSERVWS